MNPMMLLTAIAVVGPIAIQAFNQWLGVKRDDVKADNEKYFAEARLRAKKKIKEKIEDKAELERPARVETEAMATLSGMDEAIEQITDMPFADPELSAATMFGPEAMAVEPQMTEQATSQPEEELSIATSPEVRAILARQGSPEMASRLIHEALAEGRRSTTLESLGIIV